MNALKTTTRRHGKSRSAPITRSETHAVQTTSSKELDLGPAKPSPAGICKACKAPLQPIKLTRAAKTNSESYLEYQVKHSILVAHERAAIVQSAYANASGEFQILRNQDQSLKYQGFKIAGWEHVPYSVELAKSVGKEYADLGRALASCQLSLALMEKTLVEERKRFASETDADRTKRAVDEVAWWQAEKAVRIEEWEEADNRYRSGTKKKKKKKN